MKRGLLAPFFRYALVAATISQPALNECCGLLNLFSSSVSIHKRGASVIDCVSFFCLVQHILEVTPKEVHLAVNLLNVV
jgi:hypothetical protein